MNYTVVCVICLATIFVVMWVIMSENRAHERFHDVRLQNIVNKLSLLDPRVKDLEFHTSKESYTENKKKVFICMKNPTNGEYYDDNTLITVTIHELAHAFTKPIDYNHTGKEFNTMYHQLMAKAQQLGIVDPNTPVPISYCKS